MPIAPENIGFELICFAAFAVTCGGLLNLRYSVKASLLIAAGCFAVSAGIQTALLLWEDGTAQMALTLLPVTAYLPMIFGVHLLSRNGFATAVVTWSFGLLVPYILNLFRGLLHMLFAADDALPVDLLRLTVLCSLALAAFLVFVALRYCRPLFRQYAFRNQYVWIILPVILLFSLISYFESMNFNPVIAGLLLLSVLVAFFFIIKFLNIAMAEQTAKESEQAIAAQLELQRQEISRINQKMEQGRIYRHDMRHHLSVLESLADREKAEGVRQYIGDLSSRLSAVEKEDYCENATVNAVLASYIGGAKRQGIRVAVKARIPERLPVDEIDLCMILANALENAVAACCRKESERWIELTGTLHDNGNFSIDIRNSCDEPVKFGKDGLPVSQKGKGHGLGLKSIDAVVRKYGGLLRCTCDGHVFRLSAALFRQDNRPAAARTFGMKKALSNTALTLLLFLCFVNMFPEAAQAMEAVPVVGDVLRLANVRTYRTLFHWGSSRLETVLPQIELGGSLSASPGGAAEESETPAGSETQSRGETGSSAGHSSAGQTQTTGGAVPGAGGSGITLPELPVTPEAGQTPDSNSTTPQTVPTAPETPEPSEPTAPDLNDPEPPNEAPDIADGIEDMNQQMEAYIQKVEEEFLWYFSQKYHGYVASDTGYNILRNDESLLSVCFYTTLNAGGSGEYSRCFTLDKTTGRVLALPDLFVEGSDYVGVISADILRQMTAQVEAGEGDYFIPGGIWSEEECFQQIAADQNFYISGGNKLVILFDEYEVAPGSMGMPQFIVETDVLGDLLRRPSVLAPTGKEAG